MEGFAVTSEVRPLGGRPILGWRQNSTFGAKRTRYTESVAGDHVHLNSRLTTTQNGVRHLCKRRKDLRMVVIAVESAVQWFVCDCEAFGSSF